MNSTEFAHIWLETHGLFDKDSDYDGWLGKKVMEVVELIASQGHSGASGMRLVQLLRVLYADYDNPDDLIWKAYWESDEGRKVKESFEVPTDSPIVLTETPNLPTANPKRDKRGMFAMPNPTPGQLNDPLFLAIWEVIKSWDINVPEYYVGYCGATGSHVMLIFNALHQLWSEQ